MPKHNLMFSCKDRTDRACSVPVRNPSAFVLLELLAVVTALALLASLLLSGLGRAKASALKSMCQSNQRQIITAMLLYAGENQDAILPYTGIDGLSLNGGGYYTATFISTDVSSEMVEAQTLAQMKTSPLYSYARQMKIFHCPGDMRFKLPNNGRGWGSYSKLNGTGGFEWSSGAGIQMPYSKFFQVQSSANTACFIEEADLRGYNNGTWIMNKFEWVDSFAIFHGNSSTFSFADGHVDSHQWMNPLVIQAAKGWANGVSTFYLPGGSATNPDFAWAWDHYRFQNWTPLP